MQEIKYVTHRPQVVLVKSIWVDLIGRQQAQLKRKVRKHVLQHATLALDVLNIFGLLIKDVEPRQTVAKRCLQVNRNLSYAKKVFSRSYSFGSIN